MEAQYATSTEAEAPYPCRSSHASTDCEGSPATGVLLHALRMLVSFWGFITDDNAHCTNARTLVVNRMRRGAMTFRVDWFAEKEKSNAAEPRSPAKHPDCLT